MATRPYNPWMLQDRTQPAPVIPFGPIDYGQPSNWDSVVSAPSQPNAQELIDRAMALRPQRPQSGMKDMAESTQTDEEKRSSQSHEATWLTPEQVLANSQATAQIPEIQAQREAQEQNRKLFQLSLAQPMVPDLANPLSVAAHNLDPNNTVIPRQPAEGLGGKELREWAKQQQDDQRDLARIIIQGNNSSKSGYSGEQLLQLLGVKNVLQNTAADPTMGKSSQNPNWLKWTSLVDNTMKKDQDALSEAEQLRLALYGSPAAQRSVPIMLAKMLTGASRVPVQEVLMEKGDPAFANMIEQKWNTLANGTITPQNRNEYISFINNLMQLHQRGIMRHVDQGLARGRPIGLDENAMKNYLTPAFTQPHTKTPSERGKPLHFNIDDIIQKEMEKGE